jgi:HEAT repeat protein
MLVRESDISVLAGLLRDDDDIIRREAAASLGLIGHRAISAAPALVQALSERPGANGSSST